MCHQLGTNCFKYMNLGGLCQSTTGAKHFPDWAISPASLCSSCFSNNGKRGIFSWLKNKLLRNIFKVLHFYKKCILFYVFPPCIHVCYIHASPVGAKEDIGLLGTGVPGGCEPPCRCWEVNPGPLEEHPGLLMSKPSLQPLALIIFLTI